MTSHWSQAARAILLALVASIGLSEPGITQTTVSAPAGTRLLVRMDQAVNSGQAKTGDRFTATLDAAISVGGAIVVPSGATVYGRIKEARAARRIRGRAKLVLELSDITIAGQLYPNLTDDLGLEGDASGTVKKVGAAALIGAAAGDAAAGAAVGGGLALLTRGSQIEVPAETLLEFRTQQPLTVQ